MEERGDEDKVGRVGNSPASSSSSPPLSLLDSNKATSHKQVLVFNRVSFNTCPAVQHSGVHFITASD